jgi:putative endonuclease
VGHPDQRRRRARRGERLAALFLRLKGYRIAARNWRCPLGELDLVCWHGDTLVFVEVKARTSAVAGAPEDAVDFRKRKQLIRLANFYLAQRHRGDVPCRFDVVGIDLGGVFPRIRHLRSAFRADGLIG